MIRQDRGHSVNARLGSNPEALVRAFAHEPKLTADAPGFVDRHGNLAVRDHAAASPTTHSPQLGQRLRA